MDDELRLAVPEDVSEVAALVDRAYTGYIVRIGRKPAPMLDDYAVLIADGLVRVLCRDGRICGVLVLIENDDHLLLDNVAVAPEAQGLGIGRRAGRGGRGSRRKSGLCHRPALHPRDDGRERRPVRASRLHGDPPGDRTRLRPNLYVQADC